MKKGISTKRAAKLTSLASLNSDIPRISQMLRSAKSQTGLHVFRSLRQKYVQLSCTRRQLAHTQSQSLLLKNDLLVISDEIRVSSKPVVALESTIITHGLPYPQNLETALQVEEEIRALDVLPATIGSKPL